MENFKALSNTEWSNPDLPHAMSTFYHYATAAVHVFDNLV